MRTSLEVSSSISGQRKSGLSGYAQCIIDVIEIDCGAVDNTSSSRVSSYLVSFWFCEINQYHCLFLPTATFASMHKVPLGTS